MSKPVIGVDLDGVLCDFNHSFKLKLYETSGRRLIRLDEEPKCWNYPKEYGYTSKETDAAWDSVKADPMFWAQLRRMSGAANALQRLNDLRISGCEVYFMTVRAGIDPQMQSIYWLESQGFRSPCVLMTRGDKGQLAQGLGLTHMIDDKPENVLAIRQGSPTTKVSLLARRWNLSAREEVQQKGVLIAESVQQFLREVEEDAVTGQRIEVST